MFQTAVRVFDGNQQTTQDYAVSGWLNCEIRHKIAVVRCVGDWIRLRVQTDGPQICTFCFSIRLSSNIIDDRLWASNDCCYWTLFIWLHLLVDSIDVSERVCVCDKRTYEIRSWFHWVILNLCLARWAKRKFAKQITKNWLRQTQRCDHWSMCFPQSLHDTRVQIESSAIVWMDHAIMLRAQIKCRF